MQPKEIAEATGPQVRAERVRLLTVAFRNILIVVFLIFIFAVVRTAILWAVCNTGMKAATALDHQGLPTLNTLASLQEQLAIYRLNSYEYLFARENERAAKARAVETTAVLINSELKKIQGLLPAGAGQDLAAELQTAVADLDTQFQKVRSLVDADFPAAMKSMDQDIPPRIKRVAAAAQALKDYGYNFSSGQANATFASFGSIRRTAVIFGIANCVVAFCAFVFVLLAARRSRAQLADTLARLDERTLELQQTNGVLQRQQTELRESERRFAGAFEFAPIGVALVLPDGRWLKVNRAICELVGYSEAELLTHSFQDITHPDDLAADLEFVRQMLAGEILSYQMEKRYRHQRGHLITALLNVSLVRDAQDQPLYFIAQIQDITARRLAETLLAESQQRLALATQAAHVGIWDWDVVANKLDWDARMFELYGIRAEDFSGAHDAWQKGLHPDDRARGDAAIHAALDEGKKFHIEFRVVWPDGQVRHLEAQALVQRADDGSPTRMIGVNWDITERKKIEAQLFQSQKMETVGKLAGGVAHEFNSILTAIIGQSELLLDDLPAGSSQAESATEITKAANRAATLTRQLLAYGRKQFLQPELLNLNSVLAATENTLRHLMGRGVDVRLALAADLKVVKADAGQIEQVLMNLAMNAADAMPNGGKLTLETANVTLDEAYTSPFPDLKSGDYVMLAVTDTGTGMTAAVKARLFEPFFTTKDVGEGTGLGLSTCYGIVKQSGGHMSVYSEPGRGTTFKIYLPQVEPLTPPLPRLESSDLPRGTETILLVEDDPALREMAATLLRRLGYTVLAAANGIEALSLKQQPGTGHIDLLFTDVVMPHMSGKELADRVRALYPHTKILFTSAYTENAIVHQGVLDKGVALLQKPFTPSALARKLREVLEQPPAPETV